MVISLLRRLLAAWLQNFGLATAANPKARRAGSSESCLSACAFCLALHRTGVTSAAASPRRWCALTLRPCGPHRFTISGTNPCCIVSVALSRRFGFLRAGSPLATVLPCGVRTFLTATWDTAARPSSLFLILSITCYQPVATTRMTSSNVVTPSTALRAPSAINVFMPPLMAICVSSSMEALRMMASNNSEFTRKTS